MTPGKPLGGPGFEGMGFKLVGVPRALGMGSYRLSVWTFDQLECGNVGAFQPRLQYGPADFTGYVTGMRH